MMDKEFSEQEIITEEELSSINGGVLDHNNVGPVTKLLIHIQATDNENYEKARLLACKLYEDKTKRYYYRDYVNLLEENGINVDIQYRP